MADQQDVRKSASPATQGLYRQLLAAARAIGPFEEELKKTCVHLVRESAFAGVHFRKDHLLVTLKSAQNIDSPRVFKAEQASRNRWHIDVKVTSASELDGEFTGWLRSAYDLCA